MLWYDTKSTLSKHRRVCNLAIFRLFVAELSAAQLRANPTTLYRYRRPQVKCGCYLDANPNPKPYDNNPKHLCICIRHIRILHLQITPTVYHSSHPQIHRSAFYLWRRLTLYNRLHFCITSKYKWQWFYYRFSLILFWDHSQAKERKLSTIEFLFVQLIPVIKLRNNGSHE